MDHPRVQILDGAAHGEQEQVVPVYPLTEELRADQLRTAMRQAVERGAELVPEILPPDVRTQRNLPDVVRALNDLHFPEKLADALAAKRRFIYEEFFVLQVALALRRRRSAGSRWRMPVR